MAVASAAVGTHMTPYEGSTITRRKLKGTAATYYPGAMVSFDSAGYVVKAGDTASTLFAGLVDEPFAVTVPTGSSDGDVEIRVARPRYFRAQHSGLTIADVGKLACVSDDTTVALAATTTNDVAAGRINAWISTTEVEIEVLPVGQNA